MSIYKTTLWGPTKPASQVQRELKERNRIRSEHARRSRLEKLRNDPETRGRNDHLKMSEGDKRKRSEESRGRKEQEYQIRHKRILRELESSDQLENNGYLLIRR